MPKPKVCFISPHLSEMLRKGSKSIAGAQLQVYLLATEMAERGYDVSVITYKFNWDDIAVKPAFRMISGPPRKSGLPIIRFFNRMRQFVKACKIANADYYTTNNFAQALVPALWFARRNKRKAFFIASSDANFVPDNFEMTSNIAPTTTKMKMMFYYALRRCDGYVVHNEFQQRTLKENFGKDGHIIPNGFANCDHYSTFDGPILWVSNVREVKNPFAFLEVARKMPDKKFVLVGGIPPHWEGELKEYYDRVVEEGKTIPNLEMPGFLPLEKVEPYFDKAEVYINSSNVEAMPNLSFLQAWSRGIPVVTFHDPEDTLGRNGLGKSVNNVDEMVDAVQKICDGDLKFSQENIKQYFDKNYSIASAVDRYEKFFMTLEGTNGTVHAREATAEPSKAS